MFKHFWNISTNGTAFNFNMNERIEI